MKMDLCALTIRNRYISLEIMEDILQKSYLSVTDIEQVKMGNNTYMNDSLLYSYLMTLSVIIDTNVLVISPQYRVNATELNQNLYFGDMVFFEIAIIPLFMQRAQHWVLAIYERSQARVKFFDPLTNCIEREVKDNLYNLINQLNSIANITDMPIFMEISANEVNVQEDGFNCGFHVCLIVESYLFQNGLTFIRFLDIEMERNRIINILEGLLNRNNQFYIPQMTLDFNLSQQSIFHSNKKVNEKLVESPVNIIYDDNNLTDCSENYLYEQELVKIKKPVPVSKSRLRKLKNSERMKRKRHDMSKDEKFQEKGKGAERKKNLRANLADQEKENNKTKDCKRKKIWRANLDDQEKENNKTKDCKRKKIWRANLDDQEKDNNKMKDCNRMKNLRSNQSDQEKEDNKMKDCNRMKNLRSNQSSQEKEDNKMKDCNRKKNLRSNQSSQEKEDNKMKDCNRMKILRSNQSDQEKEDNKMKDCNRKKNLRSNQSDQEKVDNKMKDCKRKNIWRANLDDQEKDTINKRDYERKKSVRQTQIMVRRNKPTLLASSYENVEEYRLSDLNNPCHFCKAVHFREEAVGASTSTYSFSDCCNHGKLERLKQFIVSYPKALKILFLGAYIGKTNFLNNIRKINNNFAFASFSSIRCNIPGRGPPCYKIQGQVYHLMNTALNAVNNEEPTNGQLFMIEIEEAIGKRAGVNLDCDLSIISIIEVYLRANNPYAKAYIMMKDELNNQKQLSLLNKEEPKELKLLFSVHNNKDQRIYNLPTSSNEVAAVFSCGSEGEIPPANIVVHEKNRKELTTMKHYYKEVEPMLYPLLYPKGERGWSIDLKDTKGKKISMCDFTSYRLSIRDQFTPHHYAGKLFQQWLVDNCARIEWERLEYIRHNQIKIKAANYKGLSDFLHNYATTNNADVGRQIVLPSSFIGSPRYMLQLYQDSMAIVGKYGKPDIFLTMTCNPNDPDIIKCLKSSQNTSDRPDIVARVFYLKKRALLKEIKDKGIFGKVLAYVGVIEFQKRGLPHMHLLITLSNEDKWRNGRTVDKFIRAELPDKNKENELYDVVIANMMHGPCGIDNPKCPCMKNNKCSKKFPKEFRNETIITEDGYPLYRRRDDGRTAEVRKKVINNRNVVPYNPYLLLRYKCHINVEKVSEVKAVKYLYKYIYKGYDSSTLEIISVTSEKSKKVSYDEIKQHLDARFISPVEAAWRILKKSLQEKSHSIEHLPVHLPDEHTVYYGLNANKNDMKNILQKNSKLVAYFNYNAINPNAVPYLYAEFPTYFTWNKGTASWDKRKGKFSVIGRIYAVSPREGELYHLRLLLLNVKGAKSFENLKTVNGTICNSYSEACLLRGLIKDDGEWTKCLKEAALFKFPKALRDLFVTILIHCSPTKPEVLWNTFKNDLTEDIKKQYSCNQEESWNIGFQLIIDNLNKQGKSLEDFPTLTNMNRRVDNWKIDGFNFININEETICAEKLINTMNSEQLSVVNTIEELLRDNNKLGSNCLFLDGPGGSGKTYVYRAINHLALSLKKTVINIAYSGIAATLLKNGRTVHNCFGLPVPLLGDSQSNIEVNSKSGRELRECDIIIWDEAPMSPKFALEIGEKKLKEIMKNDKLFGGKIMLLGGDFRQVLPIKQNSNKDEVVNLSIKYSSLWKHFKVMHLTKNMRVNPNEAQFACDLLSIGNGSNNDENDRYQLPAHCIVDGQLHEEIFREIISRKQYDELPTRVVLSPFNLDVDDMNEKILEMIDEEPHVYSSIDSCDSGDNATVEIMNSARSAGLPPHVLTLKRKSIVILLRNLNIKEGLCNGTRLQILDLAVHVIKCKIICGDRAGYEVYIPRITLTDTTSFDYTLYRHQFPVKLAFSMTINKSQGQTFEVVGIDLRSDVFGHGQLYVALSRVKSWSQVKVKLSQEHKDRKVKNVVFKDVLDI